MAWADLRFDVGLWNLGVATMAAGCGPLIPIDGETDTDAPNDTDDNEPPWHNTDWPEPTTFPTDTDPSSCEAVGCPPGYECVYGDCIWYDDCSYGSGGYGYCCDYYDYCCGYYDYCCDYDCYYDECYFAEDCGSTSFCTFGWDQTYNVCESAEELPECGDVGSRIIALPPEAADGAVALAFADAQPGGGVELLVVKPGQVRVVADGGASAIGPIGMITAEADASAAGVGPGFAVSSPVAGGTQLVSVTDGALAAGPIDGMGLASIVGGDFDGDGIADVAGLNVEDLWWLRGTGNTFADGFFIENDSHRPLVAADFGGDGAADIATHRGSGSSVYFHTLANGGSSEYLEERPALLQSLAGADIDGDGATDIVGVTGSDGAMLLFPWINPAAGSFAASWPQWMPDVGAQADGRYLLGGGDFDGDGYGDLFVGSTTVLRIAFGQADATFRCWTDLAVPHEASTLAVGDLDGDGRSDAAFSDGSTTTVLAHP